MTRVNAYSQMTGTIEPLRGIKVVNLSLNLPGPLAAARLASLGAGVTKIEPPDGDPFEKYCLAWYKAISKNQKALRLNLQSSKGHDAMESLLGESDLFLTSIRPSALEHLALEWKDLHIRHPRLSQVAIVGYPAPEHNKAGHDLTYQASFGLLSPPELPRMLLADLAGAEQAVSSALALLFSRERGNGAGYAEVALSECAECFAEPLRYGITSGGGLLGGRLPQYNLYKTKEGWIAVAALESHFWQKLKKDFGFDRPDVGYEEMQAMFMTRNATEWEVWAASLDLPIVAVK